MAAHLNTAVGAPLITLRRFHRDQAGSPIQYIELHASPESFELEMTIGLDATGALTASSFAGHALQQFQQCSAMPAAAKLGRC
jgi:hypothetical protein